jgi:hypothetical protein
MPAVAVVSGFGTRCRRRGERRSQLPAPPPPPPPPSPPPPPPPSRPRSSAGATSVASTHPSSRSQFNHPHLVAVYYALYRVARDYPGVAAASGLRQSWGFYLERAALTTVTVACPDPESGSMGCIPTVGLMDGTVFRSVLLAVQAEANAGSPAPGPSSWASWASNITSIMHARVYGTGTPNNPGWLTADNPAGSEFAWDTTG